MVVQPEVRMTRPKVGIAKSWQVRRSRGFIGLEMMEIGRGDGGDFLGQGKRNCRSRSFGAGLFRLPEA